jgi:hypothetical protein
MRYFTIIDFQDMVLAIFLGLCVLVLIYLAWAGYSRIRDDKELDPSDDAELISRHGHNPVPPVLIVLFAGIAIWALIYLIFFGIMGGPIA